MCSFGIFGSVKIIVLCSFVRRLGNEEKMIVLDSTFSKTSCVVVHADIPGPVNMLPIASRHSSPVLMSKLKIHFQL